MKWLIVFVMLLSGFIGSVHGQESESDVTLWVPKHMIIGETYHGVVIAQKSISGGSLVLLSAKDNVEIQQSVTILPYQNHGIFSITPLSLGETIIYATYKGELQSVPVQVFSSKSDPSNLNVILAANKTKADTMLAYVTVSDDNGSPVTLNENLKVHLSTLGAIDAPKNIMIKNQTSLAKFEMDVHGSGNIIASADTLKSSQADIEKSQDQFTVKLAVAPDIAMPNSYVFYYVWIEKDGKPFRPSHVINAFVHSGDASVGRFTLNSMTEKYEGNMIHLVDGMARGKLYTGSGGHTEIIASIQNYGTAQDSLFVGSAKFGNLYENQDMTINLYEQNLSDRKVSNNLQPNALLAWIYPSITDQNSWAVVATYFIDQTKSLEMTFDESNQMQSIIAQNAIVIPVDAYGSNVYVSSSKGLDHKGAYMIQEQLTKSNALEFELSASNRGNHKITVSGQDLKSDSASVDIVPRYAEEFRLGIVKIPAIPNTKQDLAMISIFDKNNSMIDVSDVFYRNNVDFLLYAESINISEKKISPIYSNTAIVNGVLSASDSITAIFEGTRSVTEDISPSGIATSLEILAPKYVHVNEDFPFVVHVVDSLGIPIQKTSNTKLSSTSDVRVTQDGHMILEGSGPTKISMVSQTGAFEYEITGFENRMIFDLALPKHDFRVGEDIVLEILNSIDAAYMLVTDFPFIQTDDKTFVITPDHEDESAKISVIASRDGFETVSLSETVNVQKIFSVDIRTLDSDGVRLQIPLDVVIGGKMFSVTTPYYVEIKPDLVEVVFPEKTTARNHGYALESITIDGQNMADNHILVNLTRDTNIVATYHREILINVVDAQGTGIYKYGDIVSISAPDRDKISFLVRDVFDHWEGLTPNHTSSHENFVATTDMNVVAIYQEDYAYLMLLVTIPVLGGSIFTLIKGMAGFRWAMQNILDKIHLGSFDIKKYKKNSKSKKTPTMEPQD